MKPGQKVKVARFDNNWQEGTFLSMDEQQTCQIEFGKPGLIGHRIENLNRMAIREFRPLEYVDGECPALDKMAQENMPFVIESLTKTLQDLLPNETFIIEEGIVYAYHRAISLQPVVVETRSIGAFIEHPGWSVTVWKHHPATRHEPEDISDSTVGEFLHYGQAVQKLVETLFLLKSTDYWNAAI